VTWDKELVVAATARMVNRPATLDTLVATNLHADILSDLAAALAGSLGIAPTGNIDPERRYPSMFEPIHGSAFDIMGKGLANPIGTFWSVVMLLEHLGEQAAADRLMAAIEAGRRGRRVLVIDHARQAGEKIRISGGGRCNFTNLGLGVERFLSKNPRFALSALKRFTALDFVARVDAAGIAWHEKALGQLFCDGSAKEIVAMLLDDMGRAKVALWLNCTLGEVRQEAKGFVVETENQVGAHLDSHLQQLPANDHASRAIVAQMRDDEIGHARQASSAGAAQLPSFVGDMMRAAAKVMTTVAHRV
jgi:hypothetical protein